MESTEAQIRYVYHLLREGGYDTEEVDLSHRSLGAHVGSVSDWLDSLDREQVSELIQELKERVE